MPSWAPGGRGDGRQVAFGCLRPRTYEPSRKQFSMRARQLVILLALAAEDGIFLFCCIVSASTVFTLNMS